VINQPLRGLEYYAGIAFDAAPARSIPFEVRYFPDFGSFRPYVATGYIHRRHDPLGLESHNVFFEAGHKWVFHHTHHLTVGLGVRRPLIVTVLDGSPISGAETDPELLSESIDGSKQWVPTLSVRFSRAF
jgi:hypothetical protein